MVTPAFACIWLRFLIRVIYTGNLRLTSDNLESVVITRLELDPLSPE
jgi:hypothetical protein